MLNLLNVLSNWAIPAVLVGIPLYGFINKVPVYEAFCEGAKEGVEIAFRLIPYLLAMFVAVALFRDSGALQMFVNLISPIGNALGIPEDILPLALIRPLSGSGSLGILGQLLKTHGPDSLIGYMASVIQGSTDTTFYVLTVYYGAVGIKKIRHSMAAGLVADIAGFVAAAWVVRQMF